MEQPEAPAVEIDAGQLRREGREVLEEMKDFLEKKLGAGVEAQGDRFVVAKPGVSRTEARKACRWFLGRQGLSDSYRVISLPEGILIKRLKVD